jgi:N6-L-threonylcarbamoyladenine synthase
MEMFSERTGKTTGNLVVAGGVAANQYLGDRLKQTAEDSGFQMVVPPPALCTDNAVMIAWAGIERRRAGFDGDPLDTTALARWPLDPVAARPGAKA